MEGGVPAAPGTPTTLLTVGGSANGATARGIKLKNADLKRMLDVEAKEAEIKAKKAETNRKKTSNEKEKERRSQQSQGRLTRCWNSNWR